MKRIILFCCIVCIAIGSYARHDVIYICQGEVYCWDISEYATPSDTLVYASGTIDWTFFYQEAQYDTVLGNQVILSPSVDRAYKLISINGSDTMMGDCPIYLTIHIKTAPTISIDSIHHVTCPDGFDYVYADGCFHVSLNDSVQNYVWIDVENDSLFSFNVVYYDSFMITDLRSGIYRIISHGSNGCVYRDSVIIEQPAQWVDDITSPSYIIDTIRCHQPAYVNIVIGGGTGPFSFEWWYELDSTLVFPNSATQYFTLPGTYYAHIYDSVGCAFMGYSTCMLVIYELVVDTIHLESHDTIICSGEEIMLSAYSRGFGNHIWYVGENSDSVNYYTGVYPGIGYMAEYFIDTLTRPQYVKVTFTDENHCETSDSVWVDIYNSNISITIQTLEIITDSTCTVQVSPPGGNLYLDDNLIASNIPSNYTFSTDGITVGEHVLKYAGTFGGELGLACEDEVSLPIQVEINPFVPNWEYEIFIYPNPTTTALNLSSTEMMDMTISITDIAGRVVQTEKVMDLFYTIDVSNLSSGIYLLRLVSHDGASKVVKFVKR